MKPSCFRTSVKSVRYRIQLAFWFINLSVRFPPASATLPQKVTDTCVTATPSFWPLQLPRQPLFRKGVAIRRTIYSLPGSRCYHAATVRWKTARRSCWAMTSESHLPLKSDKKSKRFQCGPNFCGPRHCIITILLFMFIPLFVTN